MISLSNRRLGFVQLLATIFGLLLVCLPVFPQDSFGRILGTITDQSGAVLPSVTVLVVDTERGVTRTLITDGAGLFDAPNLTPGTYAVRVEAKGFKTVERKNIELGVGKEVRVDLTPQPGEQQQTITVTEAAPLLETTNATLGGAMTNKDINDLPLNGRNYQNLVALRPGVMIQPGGGPWTQSTNNVRPDEVAWNVEGVLNANFFDARPVANMPSPFSDAATILPVDAIQEFNTEENPKAEWGWKPGAVVNVGIKSGTNSLHGSAYAFGRSDALDARNYFNPGLIGGSCLSNMTIPAVCAKLPAELKQYGGVVGGPIKKDKLFFFAGYEALRSDIGNSFATQIPQTGPGAGPAASMVDAINVLQSKNVPISPVSLALLGCTAGASPTCTGGQYQNASANSTAYLSSFPNVNTSDNGVAKIDYHINNKNTLTGVFFLGNYTGVGEDHAFVNQAFEDTSPIRAWSNVESWIWVPSSTTVNVFRFGYNRVDFGFLNNDANVLSDGKGYPLNTGVTKPGGLPNIYISPFGSFGGGSYLGTNPNRPQSAGPNPVFDFTDSVSYLRGKHAFRFGGEFSHIEADSLVYVSGRGRIGFSGGNQFGGASTGLEDFFAGLPSKAQLLTGNPNIKTTWMNYAAYAQDDWRITPRLTLNLGLRYSYVSPIKAADNLMGSFDPNSQFGMVQQGSRGLDTLWKPDRTDFSPRFGFAWDVTGDGKTVVRGGASIIYSSFVLYTFLGEFDFQNSNSTSIAAVPTGAVIETNGLGLAGNTNTAGGTIALGTTGFTASQLNWDPKVSANPGLNGGKVFPSPVAQCGDGKGLDAGPCAIMGVNPNLRDPYITNWNLGIQRQLANDLMLEVGYVGNHGSRLLGFSDINQPNIATGITPYGAKFPWLSFINYASNFARSNFNSLQATLTKRLSHAESFIAGYTYAHGLDNGSLNRFGLIPQNSMNTGAEYASSDFDIRHRLTVTATYNVPGRDGFGQLLKGWQLNTIVSMQTPQPWTVSDSTFNFSGTGEGADRWDFFGNPSDFKSGPLSIPYCNGFGGTITCTQQSQFGTYNFPSATAATMGAECAAKAPSQTSLATAGCYVVGKSVMVPPTPGTFGTMGRNMFRDQGLKNVDFSIFKNFTLKEQLRFQFRFEAFNIFNHPVFANPYGASNGWLNGIDPSNPGAFGAAGGTPDIAAGNNLIGSGSARVMQLGLKILF
jgi:hypothetical protein